MILSISRVVFGAGVKPQDCYEIKHKLNAQQNGIYSVYVGPNKKCIKVYCDMETDGGGWTVCNEMFRVYSTQNNLLQDSARRRSLRHSRSIKVTIFILIESPYATSH